MGEPKERKKIENQVITDSFQLPPKLKDIEFKNCIIDKLMFGYEAYNLRLIESKLNGDHLIQYAINLGLGYCDITGAGHMDRCEEVSISNSKSDNEPGLLEASKKVSLYESEFHNPAILTEGKNISINQCKFYGINSLSFSQYVSVFSGEFHGESALIASDDVYVFSGDFLNDYAFQHASRVFVYSPETTIKQLSTPKNSIIVAGSIEEVIEYDPAKNTGIYCIAPGKKAAPYATAISEKDFKEVKTTFELEQKAKELHEKFTK